MISRKTHLFLLLPVLFCAQTALAATKLNITSDIKESAQSWQKLNFAGSNPTNQSFIMQDASLGIITKGIRPSPGLETSLDVGLVFRSVGIAGSTGTIPSPFDSVSNRYGTGDFKPFIQNAYLRVNNIFDANFSLTAGRQPYTLGSGLCLSDNGFGMTGFLAKAPNIWKNIGAQLFYFQPAKFSPGETSLTGLALDVPAEGLWQFYLLNERDTTGTQSLGQPTSAISRQFYGLYYALQFGSMSFEGEAALQRGTAQLAGAGGGKNTLGGTALMLTGKWEQPMSKLGTGTAHITYGRASGQQPNAQTQDNAFFPGWGRKYDGIERTGYGEVFGATLYDAYGSTSTANGLPAGLSGIQVINLGITLPPWHGVYTNVDMFFFEAGTSASGSKSLGRELDIALVYPFKSHLRMKASYGAFTPGAAYPNGTQSPSKMSFTIAADF